ncbi:MAG: FAD-binding oxidoreductase [Minisyncoccia bacterium]
MDINTLKTRIKGDVSIDPKVLGAHSKDASIFQIQPKLVVFPKNADDVSTLVHFVRESNEKGEHLSLTPRAGGTDMSGGPLSDSIVVSFTKYMNSIGEIGESDAIAEPGTYYRDFEKQTLAKNGMILPPYPASREICTLGGMIANNAGGELTLRYGKMDRYVQELDIVLSDGSLCTFKPLNKTELESAKKEETLKGEIYRKIDTLLAINKDVITQAKPNVSKNSAGYPLWDVIDEKTGTFDLTKLFVGSQGTLGLITKARLSLAKPKPHHAMLVVFLSDLTPLPEIVRRVRMFEPESFESYDDHTFRLATRYGYDFLKNIGLWQSVALAFSFLPEIWMTVRGGVPKLVLLAEFAEDSHEEAVAKAHKAQESLSDLSLSTQIALGMMEKKYWKIRRESFSLLRKHVHGLHAAPFIDDIVVHPDDYPKFLPELSILLDQYDIMHTIAGHIGDANLHIIPLVDLGRKEHRDIIMKLTPQVYELVAKYRGSITGEHNDGIIRTPFLSMMYSSKILELFAEVKNIFDPGNIFNPNKKVGGTIAHIEKYMLTPPR